MLKQLDRQMEQICVCVQTENTSKAIKFTFREHFECSSYICCILKLPKAETGVAQ
jgi:hypothetical protein